MRYFAADTGITLKVSASQASERDEVLQRHHSFAAHVYAGLHSTHWTMKI